MMHPWRNEYPDDFVEYFRRRFLKTLPLVSHHHIVTCEINGGLESITGYAEWARHRAGDKEHSVEPATPGKSCPNTPTCELPI